MYIALHKFCTTLPQNSINNGNQSLVFASAKQQKCSCWLNWYVW